LKRSDRTADYADERRFINLKVHDGLRGGVIILALKGRDRRARGNALVISLKKGKRLVTFAAFSGLDAARLA
jgi:hypothetical protein